MKGIYIQDNDLLLSELKVGDANPCNYKGYLGGKGVLADI